MTQKGKFLQKINEAFAKSDIDFLLANVTEDIIWTAVGDFTVSGKKEFSEALNRMKSEDAYGIKIKNIITHGDTAAIDGEMTMPNSNKTYGFCDVYKLSGFKNPKIKEMTSYVVELKSDP